jgi:hypothetical protein
MHMHTFFISPSALYCTYPMSVYNQSLENVMFLLLKWPLSTFVVCLCAALHFLLRFVLPREVLFTVVVASLVFVLLPLSPMGNIVEH